MKQTPEPVYTFEDKPKALATSCFQKQNKQQLVAVIIMARHYTTTFHPPTHFSRNIRAAACLVEGREGGRQGEEKGVTRAG